MLKEFKNAVLQAMEPKTYSEQLEEFVVQQDPQSIAELEQVTRRFDRTFLYGRQFP